MRQPKTAKPVFGLKPLGCWKLREEPRRCLNSTFLTVRFRNLATTAKGT